MTFTQAIKCTVAILAGILLYSAQASAQESGGTTTSDPISNASCENANIFSKVFDQVCWDCFLDDFSLFGIGNPPDGAASPGPFCMCSDDLGVPEFGYPVQFWTPQKLNEVTTIPWCSVSLGGIKLANTIEGLGTASSATSSDDSAMTSAFFQYHYFSYPLMMMLEMLVLPSCYADSYIDFDLMYLSEVDPLWSNDLLSLVLNPEAIIFGNPLALAYCAADCIAVTTTESPIESVFPCAGCDAPSLYPLTGNVTPNNDPVASSSLITQRVLASLHRKGLAHKTIGESAMCEPSFYPMLPKTQYKFSMMHPVPEASSSIDTPEGGGSEGGDVSSAPEDLVYESCCHPMGMSTMRWCTPAGGRMRPGRDNNFVYMIWQYRDCCVRSSGGG
jgi:conjugal transfer pilus assembly protein TraU